MRLREKYNLVPIVYFGIIPDCSRLHCDAIISFAIFLQRRSFFKMCEICDVLGKSVITPRAGISLEKWIDCELDENQKPIFDRIRKNISYHLGNAVETIKLR